MDNELQVNKSYYDLLHVPM